MDTTKWKSVNVPRDEYEILKTTAKNEGRTLSGQLRLIFKEWQTHRKEQLKTQLQSQEIVG